MDKNHDGKIDVNELCNSMIIFYHPETYRNDAKIWKKISNVNWIPMNKCFDKLISVGLEPSTCWNSLELINLERNPNITFSQFLRAKNTPFRNFIENPLKRIVSSIDSPESIKGRSPEFESRHTKSIFKNQDDFIGNQTPVAASPNRPEAITIKKKFNNEKGFSFSDNVPPAEIIDTREKTKPQIVRPRVQNSRVPIQVNRFDMERKMHKPRSPFFKENFEGDAKPKVVEIKNSFDPKVHQVGPQIKKYSGGLSFDNSKLTNSSKKPKYSEKVQRKIVNPPKTPPKTPSVKPLNLNQNQQNVNRNPIFLRTRDISPQDYLAVKRNNSRSRSRRVPRILQCTPLLDRNSASPNSRRNIMSLLPQPPTIIKSSVTNPRNFHIMNPGFPPSRLIQARNPFNVNITQKNFPIRIDGRILRTSVSPMKERTPSPIIIRKNQGYSHKRVIVRGNTPSQDKLGRIKPKYVRDVKEKPENDSKADEKKINKKKINEKKLKKNIPLKKQESPSLDKGNKQDLNEMKEIEEHNMRHKNLAQNQVGKIVKTKNKPTYSPPKIIPQASSSKASPLKTQISLESVEYEESKRDAEFHPVVEKSEPKESIIEEENKFEESKIIENNPIQKINIDRNDFKKPSKNLLKTRIESPSQQKKKILDQSSPSSTPAPLIKKRLKSKTTNNPNYLISQRIPLGLNNIDCREIALFLKSTISKKESKSLNKSEFKDLMMICKPRSVHQDTYTKKLEEFFDLIDVNKNGKAERTELANTLILMSKGDKQAKIQAAFDFYDQNGDNNLDRSELTDYFIGVLKLKWISDRSLSNYNPESIDRIAAASCLKCFELVDQERRGLINHKQFSEFILNGGEIDKSNGMENDFYNLTETKKFPISRGQIEKNLLEGKKMIDKVRIGFPFDKIHISVALHCLNSDNEELRVMDKMRFKDFLKRLIRQSKIKIKFRDGFDSTLALFFKIFDTECKGIIEIEKVAVGLFLLCGNLNFILFFSRWDEEGEIEICWKCT